jgi:hypothetical protein
MTIDEQEREYMRGWCDGTIYHYVPERNERASATYHRGFKDGAAACLAAEKAERERLNAIHGPAPAVSGWQGSGIEGEVSEPSPGVWSSYDGMPPEKKGKTP